MKELTTDAVIATKFTMWAVQPLETLKRSKVYRLREKLNSGNELNSEEKKWLSYKVSTTSHFKFTILDFPTQDTNTISVEFN